MNTENNIQIGDKVHVKGWKKAAVFQVEMITGTKAKIVTKKGKWYNVEYSELYPINFPRKQYIK